MKCLRYYAKLDGNRFPIPSTMTGTQSNFFECRCDLVELLPTDSFTGVNGDGKTVVQSYHPNKLRYFVRVTCDGKLIPNSLFTSLKHPGGNVAEYKKTYVVS